ncbi:hypothetical protein JTB14_036794 [Gonioctena quinquepunctata]|nr:hypothetical protein JTB14_036794 [Gonioctena quinquepunctata]
MEDAQRTVILIFSYSKASAMATEHNEWPVKNGVCGERYQEDGKFNEPVSRNYEEYLGESKPCLTRYISADDHQEFLYEWKSKTKKKARVNRENILQTGGGGYKCTDLNELENRLISIYGWVHIVGICSAETVNMPLCSSTQRKTGAVRKVPVLKKRTVQNGTTKLEKAAQSYSQSTEQMALAVREMAKAISELAEA